MTQTDGAVARARVAELCEATVLQGLHKSRGVTLRSFATVFAFQPNEDAFAQCER
jgi:hypothetical protein